MKVVRTPSFWRDLQSITDYFIQTHATKAAGGFARAVDETIEFIKLFPDLGNPWESADPDLAGLRYRIVKKFRKHVIIYRKQKRQLVILRLFHASQDIEELLRR